MNRREGKISYTTRGVNIITAVISILVFSIINFAILKAGDVFNNIENINASIFSTKVYAKSPEKTEPKINKRSIEEITMEKQEEVKVDYINVADEEINEVENTYQSNNETINNFGNWIIEIPSINLLAPIEEGTTKEVMDRSVGHFENTSTLYGNIGLIAHNRGYPVNYFNRLKELKIGDTVIYTFNGNYITYKIQTITVIKDTDWSYLEETKDNRITLITCVENEPEYRRCIQGVEI